MPMAAGLPSLKPCVIVLNLERTSTFLLPIFYALSGLHDSLTATETLHWSRVDERYAWPACLASSEGNRTKPCSACKLLQTFKSCIICQNWCPVKVLQKSPQRDF